MMSDEVDKTPNIDLNETDAVTVRFKKTIIAKMDELTEKKGFRNKQDLIREAVRKYLEEIA
jgi:metal-responsive CopG/Arc/MetJ family transcriptional regulator